MENRSQKAPFLPLIWRELQLCSKKLYINMAFTAVLSIIGILFPLSFKYGNLKLIFVEISSASLWQYMHYGIIAYIGYMFSAFSFVASESVIEDTKKKWVLFLKSTPVTPCKLAMAKYVFKFVMIAFQLLLSFAYAAIICSLCDKSFDIKVVAIILILAAFTLIFSTIMELFAHLTASTDKAGLCTMGVMLAIAFALMPFFEGRSFGEIIKSLTKSCDIFVAVAPAVMLCVFAIGFICTIFLYRRYEK